MVPEKSLPPSLKANCKDDARSKRQPMNISTRRGIDARARSLRPVSPPVYVARLPPAPFTLGRIVLPNRKARHE